MEHFPFLTRLEVLPEWEAAARLFLDLGGVALVLGAPDTGKSTLSRYLVYRAYRQGQRVALVDLDLGQSHLGPPATIGLGLFPPRRPGDEALFPEGIYFIGQTSPVGAILEVVVGCRVLADLAGGQGATQVVVNTSGFVQGLAALRLKRAQAQLLHPNLILGLQRQQELEPLLRGLAGKEPDSPLDYPAENLPPLRKGSREEVGDPGKAAASLDLSSPSPAFPQIGGEKNSRHGGENPAWGGTAKESGGNILRLPVSSRVRLRSPDERRRYREERFRLYFSRARRLLLPWPALSWQGLPFGLGEPFGPLELRQWGERLGVEVLHGESAGRRTVLLLAQAPPADLELARETVHWLSWPVLSLRLVGLLDRAHRTLALGLIHPSPWDRQVLALWTPLPPSQAAAVRFVKVGKMRLSLEGRELSAG